MRSVTSNHAHRQRTRLCPACASLAREQPADRGAQREPRSARAAGARRAGPEATCAAGGAAAAAVHPAGRRAARRAGAAAQRRSARCGAAIGGRGDARGVLRQRTGDAAGATTGSVARTVRCVCRVSRGDWAIRRHWHGRLRRFERDLLEALGFGFAFDVDGDGVADRCRRALSAGSGTRSATAAQRSWP